MAKKAQSKLFNRILAALALLYLAVGAAPIPGLATLQQMAGRVESSLTGIQVKAPAPQSISSSPEGLSQSPARNRKESQRPPLNHETPALSSFEAYIRTRNGRQNRNPFGPNGNRTGPAPKFTGSRNMPRSTLNA